MKEQFADYETSNMLKELGFDEETIYYYRENNKKNIYNHANTSKWNTSSFYKKEKRIFPNTSAPLWQQVKQWLWEKHRFHTVISVYRSNKEQYGYDVNHIPEDGEHEVVAADKKEDNILSPITADIEGIKAAVKYLHEQLSTK